MPVIGPGPDNPLGRYAFYLGWPSYMIHGTNKPAGVGLRSSHGCIRLYPEDIEQLFEAVPLGTKVRVVNEPFVFGWQRRGAQHPGLRCARGRSARLEEGREEAPVEVAQREHPQGAQAPRRDSRLGAGLDSDARSARHSGVDLAPRMPASSRSSPPRAASRTASRTGRAGTANRTCRWTSSPSARWSRTAIRKRAPRAPRRRRRTRARLVLRSPARPACGAGPETGRQRYVRVTAMGSG